MSLILIACPTGEGVPVPAGPIRLAGADIVIGSAGDADVAVADPRVAPRHCQIGERDGRYLVVDIGGQGTRLNGRTLDRPATLASGDRIGVGGHEFAVTIEAAASAGWAGGGGGVDALLAGAGLPRAQVHGEDSAILRAAGTILSRLVGGMVTMLAARARAKAEMGAEATGLAIGGGNPMKLARDGGSALALLLSEPQAGVMPAEAAVADALADLEAHQAATLRAMQGAMAATLDRFSPAAIRSRAARRGVMARVLPAAREAALWQAYEREFDGVAKGSGDAFVELFARQFAEAYKRVSSEARPPS